MPRSLLLQNSTFRSFLVSVALVALVCVAYYPALSGPFLFDDFSNIPPTRMEHFSWQELWRIATSNQSGIFGRPISVASFSLNFLFGDGSPFGFKLINLLLHMAAGGILFCLLQRILVVVAVDKMELSKGQINVIAAMATAIWMLHPLQVSSVMYVVQRMNILATLFVFLSLLMFVKARMLQLGIPGDRAVRLEVSYFMASAALAMLATLCKENGVLTLVYLFLLELIVFRFRVGSRVSVLYARSFAVLAVIGSCASIWAVQFYVSKGILTLGYQIRDFTLVERLMTQPGILMTYLSQILWPNIDQMSLYHDTRPVLRQLDLAVIVPTGIILVMCLGVWRLRYSLPIVAIGVGLFLGSHLLESTIFPLELMYEHRNYLGLAGISIAFAYAVFQMQRWFSQRLLVSLLCMVLLGLTFQTHSRSVEWSSELSHNAIAATSNPDSLRAQTAYAITLTRLGRNSEAETVLVDALKAGLGDAYVSLNLISLKAISRTVQDEDIDLASEALKKTTINLGHASTLVDLYSNFRQGYYTRPHRQDMIRLFSSMTENPSQQLNLIGKSKLKELYALLLVDDGKDDEGLTAIQAALLINPDNIEALLLRGHIEKNMGKSTSLSETLQLLQQRTDRLTAVQAERFLKLSTVESVDTTSSVD